MSYTFTLDGKVIPFVDGQTIAYIWVGAASYPHYIFIAAVETLCLLLIVWFAWQWRNPEGQP